MKLSFQDATLTKHKAAVSKAAVFCDDGKSPFPAYASFDSFKRCNPSWTTVVLCTKNRASFWADRADEVYIVDGKGTYLGPKQYIYSAPLLILQRDVVAYLDLDLIHLKPLPEIDTKKEQILIAEDASAKDQTFRFSVVDRKIGIYHSVSSEAKKLEKLIDEYNIDPNFPVFNTGVVIASWRIAKTIAMFLQELNSSNHGAAHLWRWMKADNKQYFTRHREQAVFQMMALAILSDKPSKHIRILPPTYNWQVIDPTKHNVVTGSEGVFSDRDEIQIIHFNGYANPKGPAREFARKFCPYLLARTLNQ